MDGRITSYSFKTLVVSEGWGSSKSGRSNEKGGAGEKRPTEEN